MYCIVTTTVDYYISRGMRSFSSFNVLFFLIRLLVECFTKYGHLNEAVRHFRALAKHPGATKFLYNEGEGRETDPLSLYLRGLCLEGMYVDTFFWKMQHRREL